jgi:hypothetical protein
LATAAWLAAQTSLVTQSWRTTTASITVPSTARLPNQPLTVTLNVSATNLTGTKIIWEAQEQEPIFGNQNYTFIPAHDGSFWIEAEVQWPDGRRAFATNTVLINTNAAPQLTAPQKLMGGGFGFVLAGTGGATYVIQASTNLSSWANIATNILPQSGSTFITDTVTASRRYYRALKAP